MITTGHVRTRGNWTTAVAAKMADLEGPPTQHRAEAATPGWAVIAPRAAALATLAVVGAWVHKLGGVSASKDVAADGSISTDRCGVVCCTSHQAVLHRMGVAAHIEPCTPVFFYRARRRLFNWHPVLMILAFGIFMSEAVLAYKVPLSASLSRCVCV
jgi:hypothetical protein